MSTRPCLVADCIWSEQDSFCLMLQKASVPLDEKWPLLILNLRGIKKQPLLSNTQKAKMQDLLLQTLQSGDFSDDRYQTVMTAMNRIIIGPYEDKLGAVAREIVELNREMEHVLGRHTREVISVTQGMDDDLARGQDPEAILTNMRTALKNVVAKMEEDTRTLKSLSHKDSLTGIANRRSFDDFLENSIVLWRQHHMPVSMIMFDIDHFKKFNDTYGHLVGDHILRKLSAKIQKLVDEIPQDEISEALLARYGGEEFAIILRGDAARNDDELAESIRDTIEKTNLVLRDAADNVVKRELRVTVSVGLARLWSGWSGALEAELIESADRALYHAKQNGRNCSVLYRPEKDAFVFLGKK